MGDQARCTANVLRGGIARAMNEPNPGERDTIVARRSSTLDGEVRIGGAKNSVLKLMAACLGAEGRHVLANVPDISDVSLMCELFRSDGRDRCP